MQAYRLAAVSWCALALTAPFASPAHAVAPEVTFAAAGTFVPSEVTIVEGGTLTFVNLDAQLQHDFISRDNPGLFRSDIVSAGGVSEVRGVSSLAPSVYPFTCSVHDYMLGNLTVLPLPKP
jgi:plastocyanin